MINLTKTSSLAKKEQMQNEFKTKFSLPKLQIPEDTKGEEIEEQDSKFNNLFEG